MFGLLKALDTTDPDIHVSRKNIFHNTQDPEAMVAINKGIEGQRGHFDNLGLHIGSINGDHHMFPSVKLRIGRCTWSKSIRTSMDGYKGDFCHFFLD
jgi:hypothetical protein